MRSFLFMFLSLCGRWDPVKRMTPDEGMQHEWIHEGRLNKLRPKTRPIRKPGESDGKYEYSYRRTISTRTGKSQRRLLSIYEFIK